MRFSSAEVLDNFFCFPYYAVMATVTSRDRDHGVTTLPILIPTTADKRHGEVTFRYWTGVTERDRKSAIEAGLIPERDLTTDIMSVCILPSVEDAEFKRALKKLPEKEQSDWFAFVKLIQAVRTRSSKGIFEYMKSKVRFEKPKRVRDIAWAKQTLRQRMQYPLSELSAQLNRKMKSVRFVLWWVEKEKKFAPGLFCQDLSTALAAALVSHIASPRAVAVCERCGKQFIRTKTIQLFCSLRCGNAERKARQRAGKRGKR